MDARWFFHDRADLRVVRRRGRSLTNLVVNDAGDAGNGTCAPSCTLRDALANIADGGTVTFDQTAAGDDNAEEGPA